MKKQSYQAPRGMHDIIPTDQPYWQFVYEKGKSLLEEYGFERIDTPILESTGLFVRGIGETTEIVEKEMYNLKTKGGDEFSLRPEGTAGMVRAYIEHGMNVLPHPIQLWTYGQMFRHENPQSGRLRQLHQLDAEMFGDESYAADAQLILMAYRLLENIGLKGSVIRINSIGDSACRPQYIKALKDYFHNRIKKMCSACQARFKTNVLRMLDCKGKECKEVAKDAPQIFDYLDPECKKHFKGVLEVLEEANLPYVLDNNLVRGLDYYTRTVFEIWPEEKEGGREEDLQFSICAGGRYDKLVELLGGPKTPAVGWALGMERVILLLKKRGIKVPEIGPMPKVFIVQLGDMAKRKSLVLFEELRKAGITAKISLGRDSIKSQLRIANRFGINYAIIIGQKEALENSVILREMDSGVQENIPREKIVEIFKQKIKKR
ncbi:MAG: histidyl-tRNA synthetase [Parcubacteria group bacterium Licking1014_17]|nr:MAG: histidyl-tRNA synthetase [Parcubacteria group bacterium Licking1014_17]